MKKVWVILKKEFRGYFFYPLAVVVIPAFLFFTGLYFYTSLINYQLQVAPRPEITLITGVNVHDGLVFPFFNSMIYIFMLTVPVVTMRLIAEEKRTSTWELLLTYPLKNWEVLLGKYLGSLSFVWLLLLLTVPCIVILAIYGDPEIANIGSLYLGFALYLAFYVAVGLLASLLTENQIIAALTCFGVSLFFYLLRWLSAMASEFLERIINHLVLIDHMSTFAHGLIKGSHIVSLITTTMALLLISIWELNRQRS